MLETRPTIYPRTHMNRLLCFFLLLTVSMTVGCNTVYYKAWEKFGYEKRDLLVSQVQTTREQQEETKQQFASALDEFRAVYSFDGGDVETTYDDLNSQYEASNREAQSLRAEIKDVKSIGECFLTNGTTRSISRPSRITRSG